MGFYRSVGEFGIWRPSVHSLLGRFGLLAFLWWRCLCRRVSAEGTGRALSPADRPITPPAKLPAPAFVFRESP